MTDLQNRKYFRRWAEVVRCNDWSMIKGRLNPKASRTYSEHHKAVWKLAETLAQAHHRAVTAEDLRHGCHLYAFGGKDCSHKDFTNAQFSRLLALWGDEKKQRGLLIEPDCLTSRNHWDDPTVGEVERLKAYISKAPEAYVRAISADRFGTRLWEWLEPGQLRALVMTLRARRDSFNKPVEAAVGEDNEPF